MKTLEIKARYSIIILLLLGMLLVLACSRFREYGGWGVFIKPLKVGNQWVGTVTKYDSTGAIVQTQRFAEKIVADTVIDGETWYLSRFYKGEDSSENRFFTNRNNGLWSRAVSFDLQEILQPELCAKYTLAVGDTFRSLGDELVTITANDAHLKTRIGEFDCIVFRQAYPESSGYREDYYAGDIGLVKVESYRSRPGQKPYLDWRYEIDIVFLPGGSWWSRD